MINHYFCSARPKYYEPPSREASKCVCMCVRVCLCVHYSDFKIQACTLTHKRHIRGIATLRWCFVNFPCAFMCMRVLECVYTYSGGVYVRDAKNLTEVC